MKARWIAVAWALSWAFAETARACSCAGWTTVCEAFNKADAVFVGAVKSVQETKVGWEGKLFAGQIAQVEVETTYKGIQAKEATFTTMLSTCDPFYEVGQRWLFYAYYNKKDKTWSIRACDRSTLIEHAANDLLFLGGLPHSAKETRLSGTISFKNLLNISAPSEKMAGMRVRVTGQHVTREVVTDGNGVYEIYGLPAGKYIIEPAIPAGWKLGFVYGSAEDTQKKAPELLLTRQGCAELNFALEPNTSISGRVLGVDGKPLPDVCLRLIPADSEKADNQEFDCTDKEGHYKFDAVPPGNYIILANDDGKISGKEPFPVIYYPGVFEREKAQVFSIALGNEIKDLDFRISSQEPTKIIRGVLLYADGQPVADESVEFQVGAVKQGYDGKARTRTDKEGRFSLTLLQGLEGWLFGVVTTYEGDYVNCPQVDKLIKRRASGSSLTEIETNRIRLAVNSDLEGIKLTLPFPRCAKAERK